MLRNRTVKTILFFLLLGLVGEISLWCSKGSIVSLILMSPVLALARWIENHLPFLENLSPLANELVLVFPLTLLYFGVIGAWLGQLRREEGFLKYALLVCFLVFLAVLHWLAFATVQTLLYAK